MSKLIFTSDQKWYETILTMMLQSGFNVSHSDESLHFSVFKKLNIDNLNFYEEGDSFIAINGTMIYREKIGQEALCLLLKDFQQKSVQEIRKELCGTFVIFIKNKDTISVFIDETGAYAFYYYKTDNNYLMFNNYYHIEKCITAPLNKFAAIEELVASNIYDNQTPFTGIYRLMGTELLKINLATNDVDIVSIPQNHYILEDKSFDNIVQKLAERMTYYAKLSSIFQKDKILFTTGGMDSRLNLARDIAAGITPILANWQGSPDLMGSDPEDRKVAQLMAEKVGVNLIAIDVSGGERDSIPQTSFDKYGEHAISYGNNKKWFDFFEKYEGTFFDFGYFGEILKDLEPLNKAYKRPMTADNYSYLYVYKGLDCSINTYEGLSDSDEKEYCEYVKKQIASVCEREKLNTENLSEEDCMYLYCLYCTHSHSRMYNLLNVWGYSFNMLSQKDLMDYINQIPYDYKREGKLNLALTKQLCPKLQEIPYFSHASYKYFDKVNMKLVRMADSKVFSIEKVKDMLRLILPKKVKRTIKKHVYPQQMNIRKQYVKKCQDIGYDFPLKVNEDTFWSGGGKGGSAGLLQYLAFFSMVTLLKSAQAGVVEDHKLKS